MKAEFLQAMACWPPMYFFLENNRTSFLRTPHSQVCFPSILLPKSWLPPPHPIPTQLTQYWEQPLGKRVALSFTFRGQERKKGTLYGTSLGSWDGWSRSMGLDSQPHLPVTGHLFPEVTMDLWDHGPLFLEFHSFCQ